MFAPWHRDRVLIAIMAAAALLGVIYNGVILPGYGPDEPRHLGYVRLLLEEHRLPYQEPNGSEHGGAHTYHPPLYYLALLPFYAAGRGLPGRGVEHLLRLVSLALCLAALPLIYQIAQRAGRGDPALARLAVAQIALLPMFGMTCGIINNDSALLLAVSLFLWLLVVRYPEEDSFKSALVLGACLGVGALCKGTALFCDGAALLLYLWAQNGWGGLRAARPWLRLGLALLVAGLLAGPWYLRNFHLYGAFQPVPRGFSPSDLGWLPRHDYGALMILMHPNFPPLLGRAAWGIFYSLWSQKDWIPEGLRLSVYLSLAAYCLAALIGALRQRRARPPAREPRSARIAVWACAGAFVVTAAGCLQIALFVHWGQAEGGRYLLPALAGLSLLLARGWRGLIGLRRLPALALCWSLAMIALNLLSLYWLLHYLNPTYGPKA